MFDAKQDLNVFFRKISQYIYVSWIFMSLEFFLFFSTTWCHAFNTIHLSVPLFSLSPYIRAYLTLAKQAFVCKICKNCEKYLEDIDSNTFVEYGFFQQFVISQLTIYIDRRQHTHVIQRWFHRRYKHDLDLLSLLLAISSFWLSPVMR